MTGCRVRGCRRLALKERTRCAPCLLREVATNAGFNGPSVVLTWEASSKRCELSGEPVSPGVNLHLDHRVPVARGGLSVIENLSFLSRDVNRAKGTLSTEEFLRMAATVLTHATPKIGTGVSGRDLVDFYQQVAFDSAGHQIWTGELDRSGEPVFEHRGVTMPALVFMSLIDKCELRKTCNVRLCVNHFEPKLDATNDNQETK